MELDKDSLDLIVGEEVQVEVTINSTDYTTLDLYYWKGENDDETYYSVTEEEDIDDQHGVVTIKGLEAGEGTLIVKLVDDEVIDQVSLPILVRGIIETSENSITGEAGVDETFDVTINPPEGEEAVYCTDNLSYYQGDFEDVDSHMYDVDWDNIDETHATFSVKGKFSGTSTLYVVIVNPEDTDEILAQTEVAVEITQEPATSFTWASNSRTIALTGYVVNYLIPTPDYGGVDDVVVTASDPTLVDIALEDETQYGRYRWRFTGKGTATTDPITITATQGETTATFTLTITSE